MYENNISFVLESFEKSNLGLCIRLSTQFVFLELLYLVLSNIGIQLN